MCKNIYEISFRKKVFSRLYFDRSLRSGFQAADQIADIVVCVPLLLQFTKCDLVYLKDAAQVAIEEVNSID